MHAASAPADEILDFPGLYGEAYIALYACAVRAAARERVHLNAVYHDIRAVLHRGAFAGAAYCDIAGGIPQDGCRIERMRYFFGCGIFIIAAEVNVATVGAESPAVV